MVVEEGVKEGRMGEVSVLSTVDMMLGWRGSWGWFTMYTST